MKKPGEKIKIGKNNFMVMLETDGCEGCFFNKPDDDGCTRGDYCNNNDISYEDFMCIPSHRDDRYGVIFLLTNFKFGK